jgi:hypothetical protein
MNSLEESKEYSSMNVINNDDITSMIQHTKNKLYNHKKNKSGDKVNIYGLHKNIHNDLLSLYFEKGLLNVVDELFNYISSLFDKGEFRYLKFLGALYANTVHKVTEVRRIIIYDSVFKKQYSQNSSIDIIIKHQDYKNIKKYASYDSGVLTKDRIKHYNKITIATFAISLLIKNNDPGNILPELKDSIIAIINVDRRVGIRFLNICNIENIFKFILNCMPSPLTLKEAVDVIFMRPKTPTIFIEILLNVNKDLTPNILLTYYLKIQGGF